MMLREASFPDTAIDTREMASTLPVSPLRISLVTETYPPEINGVAMTLGRLVNSLRERGHFVEVVRPRQLADANEVANSPELVLVRGLPIPGYSELRFGLPAAGALKRRWANQRPHIVHIATQGPLGRSARTAARKLGLPVSSGFHTNFDAYSRHYGIGWMKGLIARVLRGFHNGTDATLVPTRSLARSLLNSGYHNVSVVSRGIDTRLFNPQRRSASLRSAWEARTDDLVVAYVGRIAAEKNMGLVFEAFNEMQRARHDAKLVLVGDGPLLAALKTRYPQHIFTGMQRGEALAEHYASADIFLFPSLTETFGNVTVEALASGLGVVGYDYAAAAELIDNGHSGMLATPDDANGFINNAVMLATDRALLARTRLRAAASVSHLDWLQVSDIFATKLRSLISSHERKQRAKNSLAIALE
jgi:glycosyltransferase involved in cell wall biosynthesis